MHPAEELKARTQKFADDIVQLCGEMPGTIRAQRLAVQLQDAGTSVGANYRAACQARSRREFISKISTCLEEADESTYWLEVIATARLLPPDRVSVLVAEGKELSAILGASRRTASNNEADHRRRAPQQRKRRRLRKSAQEPNKQSTNKQSQ